VSKAVIVYIFHSTEVLIVGWFGTQLTRHIRENSFLL